MRLFLIFILPASLAACGVPPWNSPYPAADEGGNITYSSFAERPKHLDPAQSYSSNEITFTGQIYEPPLQYHYLKRPYTLIPLAAAELPKTLFLDAESKPLPADSVPEKIAFSVVEIHIKPGIRYQPHPAFARDARGRYLYHDLKPEELAKVYKLADFPQTGTRELEAADYVHQIKRLAHPRLNSPIFGMMGEVIVGLKEYAKVLDNAQKTLPPGARLDLTRYPLAGVEVDNDAQRVAYFEAVGWDQETAMPRKEALLALGLDYVAAQLYPA